MQVIPVDNELLDVYHSSSPTYTTKRFDIALKDVSANQLTDDKMGVIVISEMTKQKIKVFNNLQ